MHRNCYPVGTEGVSKKIYLTYSGNIRKHAGAELCQKLTKLGQPVQNGLVLVIEKLGPGTNTKHKSKVEALGQSISLN